VTHADRMGTGIFSLPASTPTPSQFCWEMDAEASRPDTMCLPTVARTTW
jgi:hypothetical protein